MMRRFDPRRCVFCGMVPTKLSKEHIIPRWASTISGRTKDIATFRSFMGKELKFSLNGMHLPACEKCNLHYGNLEGRAKTAFESIKSGALSYNDALNILDWMDKVRVGCWLHILTLSKTEHDISPAFRVNDRLGKSDRFVCITMIPGSGDVISIIATNTLAFGRMPSVFGLKIGEVFFISYSNGACMRDYFELTAPPPEPYDCVPPLMTKRLSTGRMKYQPVDRIVRVDGLKFFSFASGCLESGKYGRLLIDTGFSIRKWGHGERLNVSRSDSADAGATFGLHVLSVLELQKVAYQIHLEYMHDDTSRRTMEFENRQLDQEIEFWLNFSNARSETKHRRRLPEGPFDQQRWVRGQSPAPV